MKTICTILLGVLISTLPVTAQEQEKLPNERLRTPLQVVAKFYDNMPTGVTVADDGRIFVNFPRWGDEVPFTVAELKDGKPVAFPDAERNTADTSRPSDHFLSVQSVVIGPAGRLWALDTGRLEWKETIAGGAKLVALDLETGQVVKNIVFDESVVKPDSYLNDVRFDLTRGKEGLAFITDSSSAGHNGIIVVDLATGEARRRLNAHPSTLAVPRFLPTVEGRPLMNRPAGGIPSHISIGSDGIAIGPDGQTLYYSSLAGRNLYSVGIDDLIGSLPDSQLGSRVLDLGDKGGAADGLESDTTGAVYLTNYEHNVIQRREADGTIETLVHDPRVLWPDTLSLAADGYLYFTANQLHRQPGFHEGQDLRKTPYLLYRVKVDRQPVRLK